MCIRDRVDIDSNQQYAAQFGVRNIPTVLVFKDGELVDRKVGVSSKNDYAQQLTSLSKKNRIYLWANKKSCIE